MHRLPTVTFRVLTALAVFLAHAARAWAQPQIAPPPKYAPAVRALGPVMSPASRTRRETSLVGDGAAACSELGLCARSEPQSDGLGGLSVAAGLLELGDGLVEVPLQVIEARVPAGNVAFDPSAPALPEPELQPPEVERVGCQLAQRDADRAAAGTIAPEENARSEIVSVRPQAADHRPQQLVGEMLQRPPRGTR